MRHSIPFVLASIMACTTQAPEQEILQNQVQAIKLSVPYTAYAHYEERAHGGIIRTDYTEFVTPDNPLVQQIAQYIAKDAGSREQVAARILRFVHGIKYGDRKEGVLEHAKYPLETLIDGEGDCEDTAILAASLAKAAHLDVVFIDYPMTMERPGHLAVGFAGDFQGFAYRKSGKRYFYAETTDASASIGSRPKREDRPAVVEIR